MNIRPTLPRNIMIESLVKSEWERVRDGAISILMSVPRGINVYKEFHEVIHSASGQLEQRALTDLAGLLRNYPSNAPFAQRLEEDGDLWRVMSNQVQDANEYLVAKVGNLLDRMAQDRPSSSQTANSVRSLPELKRFITYLSEVIQRDINACPVAPPAWTYQAIAFPPDAETLSRSTWLKMLGMARPGISMARQRIHQDWKNKLERFMKETRRYFLRPLLTNLISNVIPDYHRKIQHAEDDQGLIRVFSLADDLGGE